MLSDNLKGKEEKTLRRRRQQRNKTNKKLPIPKFKLVYYFKKPN